MSSILCLVHITLSSLSSNYYIGTINSDQRLELVNTIEFENRLKERIQTQHLKLNELNNLLDSDVLMNEIDIFESILGSLSDLKYGDKVRAMEIAETNNNFLQVIHLRKQLNI
ncbi:MAG: hypothetical protein GEU26_10380 [Nitrososphaeraceae archaeon]|nr:hypothetical protein [Nitrososphaeraceae archaeon]